MPGSELRGLFLAQELVRPINQKVCILNFTSWLKTSLIAEARVQTGLYFKVLAWAWKRRLVPSQQNAFFFVYKKNPLNCFFSFNWKSHSDEFFSVPMLTWPSYFSSTSVVTVAKHFDPCQVSTKTRCWRWAASTWSSRFKLIFDWHAISGKLRMSAGNIVTF